MTVRFFPGTGPDDPALLGGKGASLVRTLDADLPVPPGAILTTDFFAPWLDRLTRDPAWRALLDAPQDDWHEACAALSALVPALPLDPDQQQVLDDLPGRFTATHFAVRSSSPDEDLANASFAGGYTTRLDVPPTQLVDAVRACFASCLDPRVLAYKRQQGFDPYDPRIAVVVQVQIDSEIAGVGFSLDPVTNDLDHAVIEASWGLGEAVVSGAVTPDHFLVDKPTRTILQRRATATLVLTDEQLLEITTLITRTEALFGAPVDIEWAYADGQLHLLQARPVTAWVPLPDDMLTAPGARRRLYMDLGLMGGLTINAPISPMGQSWFARFASLLVRRYLGAVPPLGPGDRLWFLSGGRMYQDLSGLLWALPVRLLADGQKGTDPLVADTLATIDRSVYRAETRPAWLGPWLLLAYPRAVWRLRAMLLRLLHAAVAPRAAKARTIEAVAAFEREMGSLPEDWDHRRLIAEKADRVIGHVLEVTMPGLVLSIGAVRLLERLVPARLAHLVPALTRGYMGNVVVEMSAVLHRLGLVMPEGTPAELAARIRAGDLPADAQRTWAHFLRTYGWRGPHEVDLGRPRYGDAPELALRQALAMRDGDFLPAEVHQQHQRERAAAWDEVRRESSFLRRMLMTPLYRIARCYTGTRDTPKHDYLMLFQALRTRLRRAGQQLVDAGRLDAADDVFGLTLEDLDAADADPALDLRARRAANTAFLDRLARQVKAFPPVIDSRGRILRPVREEAPGELRGMAVSAGVVRGPVRVLHHSDEALRPGEVLVAHTTDPGWTPLFVNAAAVVLGVGGVLQHRAVGAREYGKPCVAGIDDVTGRLRDGQRVEVDGGAGVVRVIDDGRA